MKNDSSDEETPQSAVQKPKQKQQEQKKTNQGKERPGCRKIPQTLIQSYDLITLKQQKKKRFNFKKIQTKQQPVTNAEFQKLVPLFGQCSSTEDFREYQFSELTVYQLTTTQLVISKVCSFPIKKINKIKLISETVQGKQHQIIPDIVKITWNQEQKEQDYNIFIKLKTVQQAYFLFSTIITRKLLLQDFVIVGLSKDPMKNFQHSISSIQGQIYKISTFRRKWQKTPAKINDSLKIFKQGKVASQIKNIKEIWTRFNMHNGYIVVKMFQGLEKVELGIPLTDYSNVQSERNWLFLLSRLIK